MNTRENSKKETINNDFNSPLGARGSFMFTEQNSLHDNLDKKTVGELLIEMNEEDRKVAFAVQKAISQIEELVVMKKIQEERMIETTGRDMGMGM